MGMKIIKDFQEGDMVTIRLEYADCRDISDRKFIVSFTKSLKDTTPILNQVFLANSNNHPEDSLVNGKINLNVNTSGLEAGIYFYSIISAMNISTPTEVVTIARSGMNGVDSVEVKKKFYTV